jgi:hypothetical protein
MEIMGSTPTRMQGGSFNFKKKENLFLPQFCDLGVVQPEVVVSEEVLPDLRPEANQIQFLMA